MLTDVIHFKPAFQQEMSLVEGLSFSQSHVLDGRDIQQRSIAFWAPLRPSPVSTSAAVMAQKAKQQQLICLVSSSEKP
jgi:hypothetical protein